MLRIKLIGFDSMGSRGMATVVETNTHKIFIDPGVSYAPRRYGLPPHPIELETLEKHLSEIHREIVDSDIVVISHYHRDHYLYRENEAEYYSGKIMFVKDPLNNINYSQRIRAYVLFNKFDVKNIAKEIHIADNSSYVIDNVKLVFSPPVPHGVRNTKLGNVIMTLVEVDGYRLLHASDVQGPIEIDTANIIVKYNPDILIISGIPTYFEGYRFGNEELEKGLRNLEYIVNCLKPGSTIIVDHHLLRDLNYREKISRVMEKSIVRGVKVTTAAEYMGYEVRQLEAMRKILWRGVNQ